MNPAQLSTTVVEALTALVEDGGLTLPDGVPTEVTVERPREKGHGDYATNVALQLAKKAGTNPRALGELLAARLREAPGISAVEVAGPGFLNMTVEAGAQGEVAADVVAAGAAYGTTRRSPAPASTWSSSRRTRPAPCTSATRGGPPSVTRSRGCWPRPAPRWPGSSTSTTAATRWTCSAPRWRPRHWVSPMPEDGYDGDYIDDLARQVVAHDPAILDLPAEERVVAFREAGYALQLREQQEQLDAFRTHFDVWFSERSLHENNAVVENIEKLRGQGHLFEEDGALWMRTTDAGDDKDRVLIRSDGELTYFASDTAYYLDKRAAASTSASTCSAPTTTATSAGCRRWPRARATTRRTTSRC